MSEALAEAITKRVAAELKRLPDGTFAPKGRGQVLKPGMHVSLPGGGGRHEIRAVGSVGVDGTMLGTNQIQVAKGEGDKGLKTISLEPGSATLHDAVPQSQRYREFAEKGHPSAYSPTKGVRPGFEEKGHPSAYPEPPKSPGVDDSLAAKRKAKAAAAKKAKTGGSGKEPETLMQTLTGKDAEAHGFDQVHVTKNSANTSPTGAKDFKGKGYTAKGYGGKNGTATGQGDTPEAAIKAAKGGGKKATPNAEKSKVQSDYEKKHGNLIGAAKASLAQTDAWKNATPEQRATAASKLPSMIQTKTVKGKKQTFIDLTPFGAGKVFKEETVIDSEPPDAEAQAYKSEVADGETQAAVKALGGGDAKASAAASSSPEQAALDAYKAAGGSDPAVLAALGGESYKPSLDTGVEGSAGQVVGGGDQTSASSASAPQTAPPSMPAEGGGLQKNTEGIDIGHMTPGTVFETNDGTQYKYHKAVNPPFHIVKPLDGGKAKPLHEKYQPPMVGSLGSDEGSGAVPGTPSTSPAGTSGGDLFDTLSKSVDAAKAGDLSAQQGEAIDAMHSAGMKSKQGPVGPSLMKTSPGRGPSGKLRNFKAMSAVKLKGVVAELEHHAGDPEALAAAKAALAYKS